MRGRQVAETYHGSPGDGRQGVVPLGDASDQEVDDDELVDRPLVAIVLQQGVPTDPDKQFIREACESGRGEFDVCQNAIVAARDWAIESTEATFARARDCLVGVDADDPAMLPGVRAAAALGFEPAPAAPLFCFLPAVWPPESRAWIRDMRVRHGHVASDANGPVTRVPWSTWDYFEIEASTNHLLVECGFDPRPAGRLWLLKPPPGFVSLEAVASHLLASANEAGLPIFADVAFADHVEREVEEIFGNR